MDSTLLTATAAMMGSVVGASASIATTWIGRRTEAIRVNTEWNLREREMLYKEFITEASRVVVDALTHSLERPDDLVALYGTLGRIRLVANESVLAEAEACCREILNIYSRPNITAEQIRETFESDNFDPLKQFSAACRAELMALTIAIQKGRF